MTVQDPAYKKAGYKRDGDNYYYRYSDNPDLNCDNSTYVLTTSPYGPGKSEKLQRGKTYYVQIARRLENLEEDDEDVLFPRFDWLVKKKVIIR